MPDRVSGKPKLRMTGIGRARPSFAGPRPIFYRFGGMMDEKENRGVFPDMNEKKTYAGKYIALAIIIPVLLTLSGFAALQITPFGDKSLVLSDANGYYMPYLSYCKSIFQGNHDLFYSFSQGIGGGIAATIWPYLLNPFSWIISLFSYEQYATGYSVGVLFITALYGLSMYLLLADIRGHKTENLLLSTCYAMSGFAVCFNINTAFFFGGPLCLPFMLLGLRKIIRKESPILYILSIAYPVVLQIQMGFAVCMAAVLFFLAILFVENHKGEIKNLFFRFLLSSLAGGLLGAVIWIPELWIIRQGRGTFSLEDFVFSSNAPLLQLGARFFTGANSVYQIVTGFPAIFCGILPVALVILYFMNKNVCRKRKLAYIALLTVYILGFYIRTFTSAFQGFTHANWLNYRFSFVFIFLILLIAGEELDRLEEVSRREVIVCGETVLGLSVLIFFLQYEFVDGAMLVVDFTLLAVMGAAFLFHKSAPERAPKRVLVLAFCLCTFFQLYLNYYFCNRAVFKEWKESKVKYEECLKKESLIRAVQTVDDGFYRMESEQELEGSIGNDGLYLDYNGVGFAGHTERYFVSEGLSRLGIDFNSACWNIYREGVPAAADALLGIKYMLSERDLEEEKDYIRKVDIDGLALYESPYALPIGMVIDNGIMNVSIAEEKNIFSNLNEVWGGISGDGRRIFTEETDISYSNHNPTDVFNLSHDDVIKLTAEDSSDSSEDSTGAGNIFEDSTSGDSEVPTREGKEEDNRYKPYIEYRFTAKQSGPIYLYDGAAYVKGYGTMEDIVQYVGTYSKGEEVTGRLYLNYAVTEQVLIDTIKELHICYADMDLLEEYSEIIRSKDSALIKDADSKITGDVEIVEGERLFFTIPYDEGWTLMVDGAETRLEKTADLFMSAEIEPGTHHFELRFWPTGLTVGIGVSVFAILLSSVLLVMMSIKSKAAIATVAKEELLADENKNESGVNTFSETATDMEGSE